MAGAFADEPNSGQTTNGYMVQVAHFFGIGFTDLSVSGSEVMDLQSNVFNTIVSSNTAYVLADGANDADHPDIFPEFISANLAQMAWLTHGPEAKITGAFMATNNTFGTLTGGWSNYPGGWIPGVYTQQAAATANFTGLIGSAFVAIYRHYTNTVALNFDVYVDGAPYGRFTNGFSTNVTSYNIGYTSNFTENAMIIYAPQIIRHTLLFSNTAPSGTQIFGLSAVVVPAMRMFVPTVYYSQVLLQPWNATDATVGQLNAIIQTNINALGALGVPISFMPIQAAMANTNYYYGNGVHPNGQGHTNIANLVEQLWAESSSLQESNGDH